MSATFVLVHGAWHGGWCYARVAKLLRDRGDIVYTPTLTGVGERVHSADAKINLTTHITDIVNVLKYEDLHDVVLCGHSYGGMVISGVVEAAFDRIAALVYLDAFVPDDGQSLHDLVPEAQRARQIESAVAAGGFVAPIPSKHFGVNEDDQAYVDALCTPQPLETMRERLMLTGLRERLAHKTYIRAGNYASNPFDTAKSRYTADGSWVVEAIAAGHDVMLDNPEALANALVAAAERAGVA